MLRVVAHLHIRLLFFWHDCLGVDAPTGGLVAPVNEFMCRLAPAAQGAAADAQLNLNRRCRFFGYHSANFHSGHSDFVACFINFFSGLGGHSSNN